MCQQFYINIYVFYRENGKKLNRFNSRFKKKCVINENRFKKIQKDGSKMDEFYDA